MSPASDRAPLHAPLRTVLVVDDEESVRALLARWLEPSGYRVVLASDADTALAAFDPQPPAVMLCDLRMPGRDGMWLATRVRQEHPATAVIISTGVQDAHAADQCLRQGAVEYLTKPFGRDRLRDAVQLGIAWHESASEAQAWRGRLEREMTERKEQLLRAIRSLAVDSDQDVETLLAMALAEREAYAHAHRVRYLAVATAKRLQVAPDEITVLARASLLHDVGKAAVPPALVRKPAALTREEAALMHTYPAVGEEVLSAVPFLRSAAAVVRDAHERMDGSGFPRGVPAGDVSLSARILGVADAYDTMTHARVFRDPLPPAEALLEIARCSGTQFDADVVAAFRTVVAR